MKRNDAIDIAKALGIVAVIVGHMNQTGNWLFSFHMPLFFILAGYFYKPVEAATLLRKDLVRLVLPYGATALLIALCMNLIQPAWNEPWAGYWWVAALYGCGSKGHSSMYLADVPVIGAVWFLLALFWCREIFNLIARKFSSEWKIAVAVIVLSAAAIALDNFVVNLPLAILPGTGALFFYWIGWQMNKWGLLSDCNWKFEIPLYGCWIFAAMWSSMSMVRCYYQYLPLDVLGAVGGTLLVYRLSWLLSKCKGVCAVLAWIGQNSLPILCFHLLDLNVRVLKLAHIPHPKLWLTELAYCVILVIILGFIPGVSRVFGIVPIKPRRT